MFPRGQLGQSADIFSCHKWARTAGIQRREARDPPKQLAITGEPPQQWTLAYQVQNINIAKVEKLSMWDASTIMSNSLPATNWWPSVLERSTANTFFIQLHVQNVYNFSMLCLRMEIFLRRARKENERKKEKASGERKQSRKKIQKKEKEKTNIRNQQSTAFNSWVALHGNQPRVSTMVCFVSS